MERCYVSTVPSPYCPAQVPKVVNIFWDTEACKIPLHTTGYAVTSAITQKVQDSGVVTLFKAYLGEEEFSAEHRAIRSELQLSGVSLTYCSRPTGERPQNMQRMVVDVLAACIQPSPLTLVIIMKGCIDISYLLSQLLARSHQIVLITAGKMHPNNLRFNCKLKGQFRWTSEIISDLPFRPAIIDREASIPAEAPSKDAFDPLVACLKAAKKQGIKAMPAGDISLKLHKDAEKRAAIFAKAGVKKLMPYLSAAVKSKVVTEEWKRATKGKASVRYVSLA
ncbi:hypothetical protein CC1G_15533 [Coprinopsis cinerea okayama7|uniref:NYN domain-containing protein n=1 Tax=Coprinopsis cinerea (strain Okayama-7 / 130 / ATCC MYA-4618 / FGSC 9003) TaxID=240176 RepID=D6RN21_COPC7|nr:hypothetical protein CC1G_15533 [Coprinopsis cinerea okayama7\|eukprot:XP_002910992.1 hypothetical protein CC1G_15533 [Coprinopsis cinerea okayama7\